MSGRHRHADPDTSVAAAAAIETEKLEAIVLEQLRASSGLTAHEISNITGVELISISPRLRPLVRRGLVLASNERRQTRPGSTSTAIVWIAVPIHCGIPVSRATYIGVQRFFDRELHLYRCANPSCGTSITGPDPESFSSAQDEVAA